VRLNLKEAALLHAGPSAGFVTQTLPGVVELTAELVEARIRLVALRTRRDNLTG
jgi:hypothetical protein